MKYYIEILKKIFAENSDIPIIYFWGHTPNPKKITAACLSQWYDCYFEIDGIVYHTTEQYMMATKAKLFNDDEIFDEIMKAYSPAEYKKLGRKIRGYEQSIWDASKYDIVLRGNIAKFSQNLELMEFLLSTGDAILAEASPYDKIWGIGLDRESALKGGVRDWDGENMLGCILMDTRDRLKTLA